jgi:hypothetical protein
MVIRIRLAHLSYTHSYHSPIQIVRGAAFAGAKTTQTCLGGDRCTPDYNL